MAASTSEQLVAQGDPQAALASLQQQVRDKPADPRLRVFLFQLLCVLGQWERALTQLQVCGELDPGALAMVNTYRPALQCEAVREAVFAGRVTPHVFGEPADWIAGLAQALRADAEGQVALAASLRAQAFDQAPATAGRLNPVREHGGQPADPGQAFSWIADADSRLGPVLEVIINGRYGWLPFTALAHVSFEAPADLRDLVWTPAELRFHHGGETVALVPTRYPGSGAAEAAALRMARSTEWLPLDESTGHYRGIGMRMLTTDVAEPSLAEIRTLAFDAAAGAAAG
jgi:type VI secretion system protein ImpE